MVVTLLDVSHWHDPSWGSMDWDLCYLSKDLKDSKDFLHLRYDTSRGRGIKGHTDDKNDFYELSSCSFHLYFNNFNKELCCYILLPGLKSL